MELKISEYLFHEFYDYSNSKQRRPRIITNLEARTRNELLKHFGELFYPNNERKQYKITRFLRKTEEKKSTESGNGYALPHARLSIEQHAKIGIITTKGTEYNSIDQKVYFAIGLVNPVMERNHLYYQLYKICSDIIRGNIFDIEKIRSGLEISPEEILKILYKYEYEHPYRINQHP